MGRSAPHIPAATPVKQTGRCSKLSGKFQHIDEILQDTGHAAVIFWSDGVRNPVGIQTHFRQTGERISVSRRRTPVKKFPAATGRGQAPAGGP